MITEKRKRQRDSEGGTGNRLQPGGTSSRSTSESGETLLFTVLAILLVGLAVFLNVAVRETVFYVRDLLSM